MPAICLSWNWYLLATVKKQDSRMFSGCFQKFLIGKHVIVIGESPQHLHSYHAAPLCTSRIALFMCHTLLSEIFAGGFHYFDELNWIGSVENVWEKWNVLMMVTWVVCSQVAKKIIFTACHSGKLKLAFTSPDVISTSPKSFLTSRIDFTVLLLFKFLKKHHLPVGQVKNRIH